MKDQTCRPKFTHNSCIRRADHMRNKMSSFSHYNERGVIRDIHSLAEVILLDHSYAKPWSAHPDASKVRPVKTLFLPREDVENLPSISDDEEIDVCEPVASSCSTNIMYDTAKAKAVMAECEKYVSTVSSKKTPDTWEEQISRYVVWLIFHKICTC